MARARTHLEKARASCPQVENHTDGPRDYIAWFEWAEEMEKTHTQTRCPSCQLFAVWVPKEQAA